MNRVLKTLIKKHSNLTNFFKNLNICIDTSNEEKNHNVIMNLKKISTISYPENSVKFKYQNILTNAAFKRILDQLNLSISHDEGNSTLTVLPSNCSCGYLESILLPCRHIFEYRRLNGIDLFDQNLCHPRWQRDYFMNSKIYMMTDKNKILTNNINQNDIDGTRINHTINEKKILSSDEKFRKVKDIMQNISSLSSQMNQNAFNKIYTYLKYVYKDLCQPTPKIIEQFEHAINIFNPTSGFKFNDMDVEQKPENPLKQVSEVEINFNNIKNIEMPEKISPGYLKRRKDAKNMRKVKVMKEKQINNINIMDKENNHNFKHLIDMKDTSFPSSIKIFTNSKPLQTLSENTNSTSLNSSMQTFIGCANAKKHIAGSSDKNIVIHSCNYDRQKDSFRPLNTNQLQKKILPEDTSAKTNNVLHILPHGTNIRPLNPFRILPNNMPKLTLTLNNTTNVPTSNFSFVKVGNISTSSNQIRTLSFFK
ncbi:uncharacterized protein LOC135923197 isoform X3 [Gordionus sp. m RMFG-2023]|uniref:uncharacterized protein LOC135923197 isoform X3 n=1 Tax=Gordionus sp. m RMFG-2023 TaxID=3053472 RepID=UPI0031FDECBC